MKIILILEAILIIMGCTSYELCYKEEYRILSDSSLQFTMYIPCKYQDKLYLNDEGYEYIYWYNDSTAIYVSSYIDFPSLNYENITSINGNYYTFLNNLNGPDTLILEGNTKKGYRWKNISIKGFNYGYVNVPTDKVDLYDRALKSFRKPEENSINKKD